MDSLRRAPATTARLIAYDALRTLSIVAVVAIHALMPLRSLLPNGSWPRVVDDVLHFCVPLFVFISGALVWGRWNPATDTQSGRSRFGEFLRRRVSVVAVPYLAWAMVFLALAFAQSGNSAALAARAPWLLLTGHVWYHLYFIPMLLIFYLLTPVAAPLIRRWPEATLVLLYAARIALWPSAAAWLQLNAPDLVWSVATHFATHLPHMALGAWFALRRERLQRAGAVMSPLLLAGGLVALAARSADALGWVPDALTYAVYPLAMLSTLLGLAFGAFGLERVLERNARLWSTGAALAFGVYFVHPLWLEAVWGVVGKTTDVWLEWWAVPAAWLLVTAASYATAWALARFGRTRWLVGAR